MSEPFIGQLMLIPYNFAPRDWFFCQGQLLPIAQYDTLFNLIGTTYGGDGVNTFALPDLRGRTAIGTGQGKDLQNYVIGQVGGVESVTLTTSQMPQHIHMFRCTSNAQNSANANNSVPAKTSGVQQIYAADIAPNSQLAPITLNSVGGSQPHDNHQPYLTLNWIICWNGVFPSQG